MTISKTETSWFERFTMFASMACVIECSLKPFAFLLLPLVGVQFLGGEWIELTLLGLVVVLGGGSIALRFFRHNRSYQPVMYFLAGCAAFAAAHFLMEEGTGLSIGMTVVGAIAVLVSQLIGRRKPRECCEYHQTMDNEIVRNQDRTEQ